MIAGMQATSHVVAMVLILGGSAARASDLRATPVTEYYVRTYGISVEEAGRRQRKVKDMAVLDLRLQRDLPDVYGGMYIEHRPRFRVVVRFTSGATTMLARYTSDSELVAETSPTSLLFLRGLQDELSARLADAGLDFVSGVDLKQSKVTVSATDLGAARRRFSGLDAFRDHVELSEVGQTIRLTAAITGGDRLLDPAGQNCSAGFNVFNAQGQIGVLSAGHCHDDLKHTTAPQTSLVHLGELDGGSYDVQWHRQPGSSNPKVQSNDVKLANGALLKITSTGPRMLLGAAVCKSGITTGVTCGEIADVDVQTNYNNALGTYVRVHNANGDLMTDAGDSGGPVFDDFGIAFGLVHGRGGNGPYANDLYFMPIDRIEVLGVAVMTEAFEIAMIPSTSGPQGTDIGAEVHYKGHPRFPVTRRTINTSCPANWNCPNYIGTYAPYTPSALTFNFRCTAPSGTPSATFEYSTTLTGADGVVTSAVQHANTCTATGGTTGPAQTAPTIEMTQ